MTKNIKNKVGNIFPPIIVILACIIILSGIVELIMQSYKGIFFLLIGIFLISTSVWIEINIEKNTYRRYTSYFFGLIKSGKWKSLNRYTDLAILKIKEAVEYASRSNRTNKQIKDIYNVCLLDSNHRMRMVLYKANSFDEANEYADNITSKLNVKRTQYSPKISEKTRLRRRR